MSNGEPEWWLGQIVAHVGDDRTLVRVGKHSTLEHRLGAEIEFQTALIPQDSREVGTQLLVSWNPWGVKRLPEISN